MRMLFTTAPLQGHFFPLVPLAWACRSIGHDVIVATSERFVQTVMRAGLPVASCGPGVDVRELADAKASYGVQDAPYAHGLVFARMALRNLSGTRAIADCWQPDLVVSEYAEFTGPIAAAINGVPHAQLRWGAAELPEYQAAATASMDLMLRQVGLDRLPTPDVTVNPWPPGLRLPFANAHRNLRHVPYDGDARMPGWMFSRAARPRVCLTLGTVLPMLGTQGLVLLRSLVDSCARLGYELVVALDDALAERLRPLPSAVVHAGRVPMSGVLRSCDLLIHHGGQGTALTALAAGCPQVVLPRFDDQLDNAAAVVRAGAGVAIPLDQVTPERIAERSRQILGNPRFREAAVAVAREIAAQPAPADVAAMLGEVAQAPHLSESA